jgi:hypothetical protein
MYISYAGRASPLASLEEAFTNIRRVRQERLPVAKNLLRVTMGDKDLLPKQRPVELEVFKAKTRKRKQAPWEAPEVGLEDMIL